MLRQLSSSNDNGQSMIIYPLGMNNAPSGYIVSWQRSEHGDIPLKVWTMLRQLLSSSDNGQSRVIYHPLWNMLRQLSSSNDNGQSMIIYPLGMNNAPSGYIVSWQRSEHGILAILASREDILWFRGTVLRQSCKCKRLPHVCLAAAMQLLSFSFPTVKLPTSCSHTSIAWLPFNFYDLIGPVWIFAKVSVYDLSMAIS